MSDRGQKNHRSNQCRDIYREYLAPHPCTYHTPRIGGVVEACALHTQRLERVATLLPSQPVRVTPPVNKGGLLIAGLVFYFLFFSFFLSFFFFFSFLFSLSGPPPPGIVQPERERERRKKKKKKHHHAYSPW